MFNYDIIYTISTKIVTIGDKIVERVFESSNWVFFSWNQNILGPSQPMEAIELSN